jgi:hypothetical protein
MKLGGPHSRSGRFGVEKNLFSCQESNPDRSAPSPWVYRLRYRDSYLLLLLLLLWAGIA